MENYGLSPMQSPCKRKIGRVGFTILLLIAFSVTQSSCTVWRTAPFKTYEQTPVPDKWLAYYDYPKQPLNATIVKEEEKKNYVFRQVEFPLYLPDELMLKPRAQWEQEIMEIRKTNEKGANDLSLQFTNRLDLYIPKTEGKKPVILISPILGGNMVVDKFAHYFASHGYLAVIVHRKKSFYDEVRGPEQVEDYLRSCVIRLREALDWLEQQPEVDPEKIGAFGISYGAVLHSVLAAIDPRVKVHILAMPAGSLPDVIVECPDSGLKKLVTKLEKLGWPKEKIRRELARTIVTDPIRFAPYVPKDHILVMASLFDRIVGASRTFKLWREMGKPRLIALPLGHYGGILIFPYLEYVSLRFFDAHL